MSETVDKIAQRFHSMLEQWFHVIDNQMEKPIYELSLILSDEKTLIKSINNTQVLFPSALVFIMNLLSSNETSTKTSC